MWDVGIWGYLRDVSALPHSVPWSGSCKTPLQTSWLLPTRWGLLSPLPAHCKHHPRVNTSEQPLVKDLSSPKRSVYSVSSGRGDFRAAFSLQPLCWTLLVPGGRASNRAGFAFFLLKPLDDFWVGHGPVRTLVEALMKIHSSLIR